MPITNWPVAERPREKLLLFGEKNLSIAELIAILLQSGTRNKNALELARHLLNDFGSLQNILQATPTQLCQYKGLGKAKYARLKASLELGKRSLEEPIQQGKKLASALITKQFLTTRLRAYSYEVFACLFLNNQLHLLAFEELFRGTLTESMVYPREIIKRALAHNASKIILAHNHPSGNPQPSDADHAVTQDLQKALALIDVQLIDHIIIANQHTFSFAEHGMV